MANVGGGAEQLTLDSVFSVFRAIDRHLQATVDAGALFLMRRGLSKGQIRWGVSMGAALGYVVQVGAAWQYSVKHPIGSLFLVLFSAVFVIRASFSARDDARAEEAGMMSRWDEYDGSDSVWKTTAIVAIPLCLMDAKSVIEVCGPRAASVSSYGATAIMVFWLILLYLKKTPRTTPPKERTFSETVTA